jgi:pseudouridine kinase
MITPKSATRIACIGGVVLDRKARVEDGVRPGTSNPVKVTSCPGGVAGNVARNLARLDCRVSLFSIVGEDAAGDALVQTLESDGVNVSGVSRSVVHATANYTAMLEPEGSLFVGLADMDIFEEADDKWADGIAAELARNSLWVIDANLPAATIERLLKAHKGKAKVLGDPISVAKAKRFRGALDSIDVIFPNAKEAAVLSGCTVKTCEDVAKAASEIRGRGVGAVIVTLGADGIYVDDAGGERFMAAIPAKRVRDVTGAGDALVAGYAYGMAAGGKYEPALFGLAAASVTLETEESAARGFSAEILLRRIELRADSGAGT